MNSRIEKDPSRKEVGFWGRRLLTLALSAFWFAGWLIADEPRATSDLTVHEWGTFTAIAGKDGQAIEWTALTGPTDLPGFVEHLSSANLKSGLRGTIRMETPVLYFYSPHMASVSVRVAFSKGVITEWYPRAASVQPSRLPSAARLNVLPTDGSIAWKDVAVSPNLGGEFPLEVAPNRYYAARETSSAPLCVKTPAGIQQEKFLFYRGVSTAPLPLCAKQNADGKLLIKSLSGDEIPAVILFERRGKQVGYHLGGLTDETVLDPVALTGDVDSLCADLETILVDQGLYPDEAHAMVETWQDSWFEEGTRLLYIVPRGFIDKVLPVTIDPSPAQIVRAFVGRLEIVTPATAKAVETALASDDEVTLNKYGRFLEPILRTVKKEQARATDSGSGRISSSSPSISPR
jgi:hypothetical protein